MKHIAGWFRRNNTIMAQAKDLSRQLQEAWEENDSLDGACDIVCEQVRREESNHNYTTSQLHRVARERDQERKKRLAAEDALLDYHLDKREEDELERAADELVDMYLEEADNEEE